MPRLTLTATLDGDCIHVWGPDGLDVTLQVTRIGGRVVRLTFEAPEWVRIDRHAVWLEKLAARPVSVGEPGPVGIWERGSPVVASPPTTGQPESPASALARPDVHSRTPAFLAALSAMLDHPWAGGSPPGAALAAVGPHWAAMTDEERVDLGWWAADLLAIDDADGETPVEPAAPATTGEPAALPMPIGTRVEFASQAGHRLEGAVIGVENGGESVRIAATDGAVYQTHRSGVAALPPLPPARRRTFENPGGFGKMDGPAAPAEGPEND